MAQTIPNHWKLLEDRVIMGHSHPTPVIAVRWKESNLECSCQVGKREKAYYGMSFCEHTEQVMAAGVDRVNPADTTARVQIPLFTTGYLNRMGYPVARGKAPPHMGVQLQPPDRAGLRHVEGLHGSGWHPMGYVPTDVHRAQLRRLYVLMSIPIVIDARCSNCGIPYYLDKAMKGEDTGLPFSINWPGEMILLNDFTIADPDNRCWQCSTADLLPPLVNR